MGRRRVQRDSGKRCIGAEIDRQTHRAFRGKLLADNYTAAYVLPILIQCYVEGDIHISESEQGKETSPERHPEETRVTCD